MLTCCGSTWPWEAILFGWLASIATKCRSGATDNTRPVGRRHWPNQRSNSRERSESNVYTSWLPAITTVRKEPEEDGELGTRTEC